MTYKPPVGRSGFWELWREQQQRPSSGPTVVTRTVLGRVVEVAYWVDGKLVDQVVTEVAA